MAHPLDELLNFKAEVASQRTKSRVDTSAMQPRRRFPKIPEALIATAAPLAVIVRDTPLFELKSSLLALPPGVRNDLDRNLEAGVVVAVGSGVEGLAKGDTVLYRSRHAYRIPNGVDAPFLFKVEWPYSIIIAVGKPGHQLIERDRLRAGDLRLIDGAWELTDAKLVGFTWTGILRPHVQV